MPFTQENRVIRINTPLGKMSFCSEEDFKINADKIHLGRSLLTIVINLKSYKVKIEGQPCIHLTSMSGHNGTNANCPAGAVIAPSQTKVIVAP